VKMGVTQQPRNTKSVSRRAALKLAAAGSALLAMPNLLRAQTTARPAVTPHYDGARFSNPGHVKTSSVPGYLWQRLTNAPQAWPDQIAVTQTIPPSVVDDGSCRVTMIGHATVLIQVAGLNILTDPVWSERASPVAFAGPKRVTMPGVAFNALPRIDVVLISHNHYDHLDVPTLRQLDAQNRPRVIVPLGNLGLVAASMPKSIVSEHDWGAIVPLAGTAAVHLEPMLHGSGRSPLDQQRTLWSAFVIKAAGRTIYHLGDSAYGDGRLFRDTGVKYGGFDLAIVPIGAYEPVSFMGDSHMTPADAVKVKSDVKARRAFAHHFGTFQLGFEAYDAPAKALLTALAAASVDPSEFPAIAPGQSLTI
jgi:L-ascorbate metabolism protein UlaG (beta-lactamase superfamily)